MSILRRVGETAQSLGLAMYTLLILGIIGAASCCTVGALWGIITGSLGDSDEIVAGTELVPQQLSGLWQGGVLPEGERPEVYHDASRLGDGLEGCLVHQGELVRWRVAQPPQRLRLHGATVSTTDQPSVLVTQGGETVECPFYGLTGRDRFARMLQSEAQRQAPEGDAPLAPPPPVQ